MTNKLQLIIALCFLALNISYSQTEIDSTAIPFVTYWSIGDEITYEVTKEKKQWKEDVLTKNNSSTYEATLTVIDSTSSGYLIKWVYETDLSGDFGIPNEMVEKFSGFDLNEVIYRISDVGEFEGIENWQEIGIMMDSMIAEVIDLISKENKVDKATIAKTMNPIRTAYKSKKGIESAVLKELHYLHFPFGIEYRKGEVLEYEESLPNLFGGPPIKGDVKIFVDSVDYETEYCVLIQQMELDEADTKKMLTDFFNRVNTTGEDINKLMETSEIKISDNNRYEYYYYPGVPNKIEVTRESYFNIANEVGKGIERTLIERIK